ncbi:hypothetical protein BD324DRAFT_653640 [Kockovaella imperatae]|uniref:Mid2 domain-containing protein n=1 Tax=Kockovaella imperatae TaxID=4999 RepID=A0A1Y1U7F3_9TREE|nr:hypothetical protein BD324DRAFT_653640 [Kockovaella imperatae]ORX33942.1 hypothetical protein BD324DRAFT_653640 [Kockovaella imperatae]
MVPYLPSLTSSRHSLTSMTVIVSAIMLLPLSLAAAQSTTTTGTARSTTTTTATTAKTSTANTGLEATPSLTIYTVPTLTACDEFRVQWALSNEDPVFQIIDMQVVNIDVPQSIPSSSSTTATSTTSSTAAKTTATSAKTTTTTTAATSSAKTVSNLRERAVLEPRVQINDTITTQTAAVGYSWIVDVPQGRYYFLGLIGDSFGTHATSNIFSVIEGSNTSCLATFPSESSSTSSASSATSTSATSARTSSSSSSTSIVPTSSTTAGIAGANASDSGNSGGGISGGAIAGIVVGAILILLLVGGCLFWRRRRNARRNDPFGGGEKTDTGNERGRGDPVGAYQLRSTDGDSHTAIDVEKDHQASIASESAHGHQTPNILLGDLGGRFDRFPRPSASDENHHQDPFFTPPSPPSSDEAYGGFVTPPVFGDDSDDHHDGRRASELPPGASHAIEGQRTRSMSHPAEGNLGLLKQSASGSTLSAVVRSGSKRARKPVPSLGAELRGQMKDEDRQRRVSANGLGDLTGPRESSQKASFQIMPDPPMAPHS